MLIKDLQVGKTLEILIDREGYHYRFVSKIEGVTANSVAVSLIATAKRSFHFEDTDKVTIVYRGERMWKWENVKPGMALFEGSPVHTFSSWLEGTTYNRREAFRVPIGESILMRRIVKVKGEGDEIIDRHIPFEALLSDLSLSGAGIYTNEDVGKEESILIDLPTKFGLISCKGKVVREAEVYDKPFRHFYGCEFSEVKNALEKYLVERQRLILQKERGGESIPLK